MTQNLVQTTSLLGKVLAAYEVPAAATEEVVYSPAANTGALINSATLCNTRGQVISTLSSQITAASPLTSLPVNALAQNLAGGDQIQIIGNGYTQTWTLSASASAGAPSLSVNSQYPSTTFPASTTSVILTPVPVTASLSVVPSGGTAGPQNRVISNYVLNAGDSLSLANLLKDVCLGPSDEITVYASLAYSLVVTLTGVVNS